MKTGNENESQQIFTPWRLDCGSPILKAAAHQHCIPEEVFTGSISELSINSGPVCNPWEQEKNEYLAAKKGLMECTKTTESGGSECEKNAPEDENEDSSNSVRVDNGEYRKESQEERRLMELHNKKKVNSLDFGVLENHEVNHHDLESKDHREIAVVPSKKSALWNYKRIGDNKWCSGEEHRVSPIHKPSFKRDGHGNDACLQKRQRHSDDSSDSDEENKENSHVVIGESNLYDKSFLAYFRYNDGIKNRIDSPCKVPKVGHTLQKNSVENLMQYAEVLYKCKLCTTLPSILTSQDGFLSHVRKEHVLNNDFLRECSRCSLRFGTEEDLRAHTASEHILVKDNDTSLQDRNLGIASKVTNKVLAFNGQCRNKVRDYKRSPRYARSPSDSDDVESCSNKVTEDFDGAEEKDEAAHPPKLVITHGVERNTTIHIPRSENITSLQRLTDEILASNKQCVDGSKNISPVPNTKNMTPCYTAEFGKYTKLVREGGNIVYFCQLCNWKSQVKMQFQGHCSSSDHTSKVRAADQNDVDEHVISKTVNSKCQNSNSDSRNTDRDYQEPLSWVSRGHMSLLTETSSLCAGHSQIKEEKETTQVKEEESKMENPSKSEKDPSDDRDISGQFDCAREKVQGQEQEEKETLKVKQNKRKRAVPVVLRNQPDCAEGWGSDDTDDKSEESGSTHSPQRYIDMLGSGGKRRLLENRVEAKGLTSSLRHSDDTRDIGDNICISNGDWPYQHTVHSWSPPPVVNMYPDMSHSPKHSPRKLIGEEEMEKTASMIRNYFESQLGFKSLDQPIKSQSALDWPIPSQTSNKKRENGQMGPLYEVRDQTYLYNCSLCDFGSANIQEYRLHFDTEHSQNQDLEVSDGMSDSRGESWKMWKIKEVLPELISVYPRGNVSRDLLLQKVSMVLSLPEAAQWGPACNKAVREQFPHSLAQRKGKYKKTFFFGVALTEHVQEQEEVSEGEGMTYQPLRDMSQDMEKILGHLHSLVQWTGDMESGVSRDEILELLKGRIEEPDVQHWGVQCNRAIRVLFPNIEMKRKGKYKTTVFYGVDFREDVHKHAFLPNKRGRPRKFPYFDQPQQLDQHTLSWMEALRASRNELYEMTVLGKRGKPYEKGSSFTRGWNPRRNQTDGFSKAGDDQFTYYDKTKNKTIGAQCLDKIEESASALDKFNNHSVFPCYSKHNDERGLDSCNTGNNQSCPISENKSCKRTNTWSVTSSSSLLGRNKSKHGDIFGDITNDRLVEPSLQPLPPPVISSRCTGNLDPELLYRYGPWHRSVGEEEGEENPEGEDNEDAADGDDEDSNDSSSSVYSRERSEGRTVRLKRKFYSNRNGRTNHNSKVDSCGKLLLETKSKGDNSVMQREKDMNDLSDKNSDLTKGSNSEVEDSPIRGPKACNNDDTNEGDRNMETECKVSDSDEKIDSDEM